MVQPKIQGNHRAYPKELAIYVERILLEETDAGLGKGLSVSDIMAELKARYGYEVKRDTVQGVLNALVDSGSKKPSLCNNAGASPLTEMNSIDLDNSCLNPFYTVIASRLACKGERLTSGEGNPAPKNAKRLYSIERQIDSTQIEHLCRLIEASTGVGGADALEHAVLRLLCGEERRQIEDRLAQENALLKSGRIANMEATLANLRLLEKAISQRQRVRFRTSDKGRLHSHTPYHLCMHDGYYYLFVGHKGAARSFDAIRVDSLWDITIAGPVDDAKGHFEAMAEEAKRFSRAGVNRMFSDDIVTVRVRCHNQAKEKYLLAEFAGNDGFRRETQDGHPNPEYSFMASYDGMKTWAMKWLGVFEILQPKKLRDDVVDIIGHKCIYVSTRADSNDTC